MNINGEELENYEAFPVANGYYVGETRPADVMEEGQPSLLRHGRGLMVVTGQAPEGGEREVSRYEGDWEDDQMHGEGKLYMEGGEEIYEGEFYKNEANGTV